METCNSPHMPLGLFSDNTLLPYTHFTFASSVSLSDFNFAVASQGFTFSALFGGH